MEYPIEASCQCGQVSYKLHKEPKRVLACHCTECQKLATGPFSVTAIVSASDIEFHGEIKEWSRIAESGNKNNAIFCSQCGNRIYHYNPDDAGTVKLKLKPVNMEGDELFEPTEHVWTKEKLSWYDIPLNVKTS
jgi:hypothetical protein|tara:strand:- start:441 stop:842 length:402 start_codon:yes stop_codon:yes gene_type:complete